MRSVGWRELAAAGWVLSRGDLNRFAARGASQTTLFERELGDKLGSAHALAVNSGTSALICALVAAGVGPGDEVLVPAYTWVSTAAAPLAVGAVPVLVEVDSSLTIDPIDIKRKLSPHTRAIIPVHMINLVADMDPVMAVAAEHGLTVIEDACQAFGLRYRGRRVGTIGDLGAFSFNQHKNIKSGEGGAVVTADPRLYGRAEMYHDVGSYTRDERTSTDEPVFVGVNLRMPELASAVLRPQLRRIDTTLARMRAHRQIVLDELVQSDYDGFELSHCHEPDDATGLAIVFTEPESAIAFGARRGARRLYDTGRHVYTNWEPVTAKRFWDPRLDPYQWAHREIDFSAAACPGTLDLLARTCTVELAPELPTPAYRLLVRRMMRRP